MLAELRDDARAAGKFEAAISAEHKRGLALGYYVQRPEARKSEDFTSGSTTARDCLRTSLKCLTTWVGTGEQKLRAKKAPVGGGQNPAREVRGSEKLNSWGETSHRAHVSRHYRNLLKPAKDQDETPPPPPLLGR